MKPGRRGGLRLLFVGIVCLASGCGASPLGLAKSGRLLEAFDAAGDADPPTRAAVMRAVLEAEEPSLTVEAIDDDELVRTVGGHTARRLAPAWLLLRARLTTRARALRYATFVLEVGQDGREVPSFAMVQTAGVVAATGERMAEGHRYSTYANDMCSGLGVVLCVVAPPLALLGIRKDGETYSPPSEQEIAAAAPRAKRLFDKLADRCEGAGACTRYALLRRPLQEGQPLSVRARLAFSRSAPSVFHTDDMVAVVERPLPPGALLRQRLPMSLGVGDVRDVAPARSASTKSAHFCAGFTDAELKSGSGRCLVSLVPVVAGKTATLGLSAPPPPASLPTFAESASQLPWWAASEVLGPSDTPPATRGGAPTQDPGADIELVVCRTDTRDRGWMRLLAQGGAEAWGRMAGGAAVIPLAHVASAGATVTVDVLHPEGAARKLIATATLTRREGALVTTKVRPAPGAVFPPRDVTCTPYDRATVEAELQGRWAAAVDVLDLAAEEVESYHVEPAAHELRPPYERLRAVRQSVAAVAALVGWSDPRAVALSARAAVVEAALHGRVRADLAALAGAKRDVQLRASLTDSANYDVHVLGVRCEGAPPCALEVSIRGTAGAVRSLAFQMVMEDGRVVPARLPLDASVDASAGSTLLVRVPPDEALPPGAKPWALLQHQFFTSWLHLAP